MDDKIWILGCGGSVSVSDESRREFGGATTCILIRMGGQFVLLDAGTGLMRLPKEALSQPELPLLLSHYHLDHLSGLPMCPYLFQKNAKLTVYSGRSQGMDAAEILSKLYAPPVWPVSLTALAGSLTFLPMPESFFLGEIQVDTMAGDHPGGVRLIRLGRAGKKIVFASDCTLSPGLLPALTEFARDCDLLLCDGQYSPAEWPVRSTFGHSTWTAAARLARDCGARRFRVIHHDPTHSDAVLSEAEEEVRAICARGGIARQGEEIEL